MDRTAKTGTAKIFALVVPVLSSTLPDRYHKRCTDKMDFILILLFTLYHPIGLNFFVGPAIERSLGCHFLSQLTKLHSTASAMSNIGYHIAQNIDYSSIIILPNVQWHHAKIEHSQRAPYRSMP